MNPRSQNPLQWARLIINRAIYTVQAFEVEQVTLGQLHQVRSEIEQAIATAQEFNEQDLEGRGWNELGAVYKAEACWADALICYQKELELCQMGPQPDQHGIACALNNMGEAHNGLQSYSAAKPLLIRAVDLFRSESDPFELADALCNLAQTHSGLQDWSSAQTALDDSIGCIESIRAQIASSVARDDFFATQTHVYGQKIHNLLQHGQVQAAFDTTERARSRGLLDLIASHPVHLPQNSTLLRLAAEEQALRAQLAQRSDSDMDEAGLERLLTRLYRQIQLAAPEYASLRTVFPAQTAEILASLPVDTALLSYFASGARIFGFCLTRQAGVQVADFPLSLKDLVRASFDSGGRLRDFHPQGQVLPPPWLPSRLFYALLQPLLTYYVGHKRLIIIPHAELSLLPIHAAQNPQSGRYLCEDFHVAYAPSATIVTQYLQNRRVDPNRRGVLAVAHGMQPELSFALNEAQLVAGLTGGEVLVGQEATPANVLQRASHYRYLHIASHGRFGTQEPLTSGVQLYNSILTAWDFLQSTSPESLFSDAECLRYRAQSCAVHQRIFRPSASASLRCCPKCITHSLGNPRSDNLVFHAALL